MANEMTTDTRCAYCDCSLLERITVEVADGLICTDCNDEFHAKLPDWDNEIEQANDEGATR